MKRFENWMMESRMVSEVDRPWSHRHEDEAGHIELTVQNMNPAGCHEVYPKCESFIFEG